LGIKPPCVQRPEDVQASQEVAGVMETNAGKSNRELEASHRHGAVHNFFPCKRRDFYLQTQLWRVTKTYQTTVTLVKDFF
jgi:hypothetical protein